MKLRPIIVSASRRRLFLLVTIPFSLGVALVAGEVILGIQTAAIRSSDHMDDGLLRYDPKLGWRLQANWRVRHEHHDFDPKQLTVNLKSQVQSQSQITFPS